MYDNAAWMREYRKRNAEKVKVAQRSYYERRGRNNKSQIYNEYKEKFFEMYGNKCACCGETQKEFLTLEHIKGMQGQKRKRGTTLWKEVLSEYRPDLYEVLCMNCNHARGHYGCCPHVKSFKL